MEIYYGYTVGYTAAAPEKDFHAGRVSFLLPLLLQQHIVTPREEFTTIGQVDGLYPRPVWKFHFSPVRLGPFTRATSFLD